MSSKRSLPDELLQSGEIDDNNEVIEEGDGQNAQDGKKNEEEAIKLTKKPQKRSKPLTEDILTGIDGLNRVYNEFPEICIFRGMNNITIDVIH